MNRCRENHLDCTDAFVHHMMMTPQQDTLLVVDTTGGRLTYGGSSEKFDTFYKCTFAKSLSFTQVPLYNDHMFQKPVSLGPSSALCVHQVPDPDGMTRKCWPYTSKKTLRICKKENPRTHAWRWYLTDGDTPYVFYIYIIIFYYNPRGARVEPFLKGDLSTLRKGIVTPEKIHLRWRVIPCHGNKPDQWRYIINNASSCSPS